MVEPNELAREAPYIRHNLDATRRAFGLDRIEEQTFAASDRLTAADIRANPLTIRNVRIWDERPLVQTFQQVQEIRPYYLFPGVDVDRYIGGRGIPAGHAVGAGNGLRTDSPPRRAAGSTNGCSTPMATESP